MKVGAPILKTLVALLVSVAVALPAYAGTVTKDEAKTILEPIFVAAPFKLYLGSFTIVDGPPNPSVGVLNYALNSVYRNFANIGVLSMPIATKFTTQTGEITAGPRGRQYVASCGNRQCVMVPMGKTVINNIVQLDDRTIGVDRYLIVVFTETWIFSSEYAAFQKAIGIIETSRQGKYKALLKYDPLKKTWTRIASDYTIGHDFPTDNVGETLHRLGGS